MLRTLDRTHDPANVARAVGWARDAGLDVSLDLIYGTPGESLDDWRRSLDTAVALEPDHVSAYALVVEEGTRLAVQVRRGEVPAPEDDDEADKYELADQVLTAAGFDWYEVSNWARSRGFRYRHNEGYWAGGDWWGVGRALTATSAACGGGTSSTPRRMRRASPRGVAGGRTRGAHRRAAPTVGCCRFLAGGIPLAGLQPRGREAVAGLVADGLVDGRSAVRDRQVRLTRHGRLLAGGRAPKPRVSGATPDRTKFETGNRPVRWSHTEPDEVQGGNRPVKVEPHRNRTKSGTGEGDHTGTDEVGTVKGATRNRTVRDR